MKLSVLALTTCAALAGCAAPGVRMETDQARMNAIERAARAQGVQVVWIHAPLKAVKVAEGS